MHMFAHFFRLDGSGIAVEAHEFLMQGRGPIEARSGAGADWQTVATNTDGDWTVHAAGSTFTDVTLCADRPAGVRVIALDVAPDVDHWDARDGSVCYSCHRFTVAGECIPCDACGLELCPACESGPCPVLAGDRAEILAAVEITRERLAHWERNWCWDADATVAAWRVYGRLGALADVVSALDDVEPVRGIVRDAIDHARALFE